MVSRKIVMALVMLVSGYSALSCPSLSRAQQQVTVSFENGSVGYGLGVRGATGDNPNYPEANRMDLSLDNSSYDVRRLDANICSSDLGSDLIFTGYEVAPRAADLDRTVTYNGGTHCIEVRFKATGTGTPGIFYEIPAGEGPVATFYFDVSQLAVNETCADLELISVQVVDNATGFFLTHADIDGQFCYYNCGIDEHCDDGIFCNGEDRCSNRVCTVFPGNPCDPLLCDEANDRCYCNANGQCDDGDWCNGQETCNVGTGKCSSGSRPCTPDSDPCTLDCDGGSQTCPHGCNAAGPWDGCCQSSPACSGEPLCTEEVTLTIGNGSGAPSSTGRPVDVSLAHPNDAVKGVQVTVCDVDNYLTVQRYCTPKPRVPTASYGCECNEIDDESDPLFGCAFCVLYPASGSVAPISAGTGPLFTVEYDVGAVPFGQERDLVVNTEEPAPPSVVDATLTSLYTMPVDGKFRVPCTTTPQCNDGNQCTSEVCSGGICVYEKISASCSDGNDCTAGDTCVEAYEGDSSVMMCGTTTKTKCDVCKGTDRCPDEGDYCDGVEYCDGGTCDVTGDPCGVTLSCDEGADACDVSDVTLTIGNGQERAGQITIGVDNPSDEVGQVYFDLCDPDKWSWLHFSDELCTTTERASGFACETSLNGECVLGQNACTTLTRYVDCTMKCGSSGIFCTKESECNRCLDDPVLTCSDSSDCGFCSGGSNPGDHCAGDFMCTGGVCAFGPCVDYGTCDFCNPDLVNDGCVGIELTPYFPLDRIAPGTGPVAQISYAVDPVTISPGTYADLNPQAIEVLDSASLPLSVTPRPGRVDITPYCEGDFENDGDVDAVDVSLFLEDFGRGTYDRPCGPVYGSCNGDFDCDVDVDALDLTVFLGDFGRGFYNQPCPSVPAGFFDCTY